MKTTILALAIASAAATSSPCTGASVVGVLTPLLGTATTCSTDSGFNLVGLISGSVPTDAQIQKFLTTDSCKTLYASAQKTISTITPTCSIGDVDTTEWSTLSMDKGLQALVKGLPTLLATNGASATNTTSNSTSNSSTVSTTAPASTTAAPAKSGVATAGVALAAAAFTTAVALF